MDFDEAFEDAEQIGDSDLLMFGMDEEEAELMKQLRDSVIFLVDCRKSMHQPNPHNKDRASNMVEVVKAIIGFAKAKIINSENDKVGVVFYCCAKTDNPLQYKNVAVFSKLDTPDAALIKNLEKAVLQLEKAVGSAPSD